MEEMETRSPEEKEGRDGEMEETETRLDES